MHLRIKYVLSISSIAFVSLLAWFWFQPQSIPLGQSVKSVSRPRLPESIQIEEPKETRTKSSVRDLRLDRDEKESQIQTAVSGVLKELREDEAARAVLVASTETDERYTYSYEIMPRSDLAEYRKQTIAKHSKNAGVKSLALESILGDALEDLEIPPNFKRRLWITAPKSLDEDVSFSSWIVPINLAFEENYTAPPGTRTVTTSGTVPRSHDWWRWSNIIEFK